MGAGKVGIVVLNWNRAEDTLECLNSLLPDVRQGLASIICCDNGSTDGSVPAIMDWARRLFTKLEPAEPCPGSLLPKIRTKHPDFVLIETGANLGYAGGNNVGIRYALECGEFDYIWILNNDTVVEPNALSALVAMASTSPEIGALGSTVVDYHDPQQVQCAGGCRYFPAFTIMKPAHQGKDLDSVLQDSFEVRLDYISGAAMFIRTAALNEAGLFNEDYFLYYEEADYATKLQCKGYRIAWCRESKVRHKGGISTGSRSRQNPKGSWLSNYHENFSTLQYTTNHHPMLLPFAAVFRLLMKLAVIVVFRRWHSLLPLVHAYRDFFFRSNKRTRSSQSATEPRISFMGAVKANNPNSGIPLIKGSVAAC